MRGQLQKNGVALCEIGVRKPDYEILQPPGMWTDLLHGADFVIKLEYQENGPLFSRLKFTKGSQTRGSIVSWSWTDWAKTSENLLATMEVDWKRPLCSSLVKNCSLKNPAQVQEVKTRLMDNLPDSVKQLSVGRASTDEVAAFLLYVKTLDYKDKPNYQHLKDLLASVPRTCRGVMPQGPAGETSTKQRAGHARGSPKAKPSALVMDEEVQEGVKSKPVPAQYKSGPRLTKAQLQKEKDLPAVRRPQRPRPKHVQTYDDDSEDDDEEEARPRPIPACYLRPPPIGPRTNSKQKTKSEGTSRKRVNLTVTSARQEERVHPQRRKHMFLDCDSKSQTHMNGRERWDERLHDHTAGYSQWWDNNLCYEHRDSFSDSERSALKGPGQEAGPTQRKGVLPWFVFVGVALFFGACVLAAKTHANPFD
ncbi:serine/threonine-protein kinase VRK2 isoform X1 [Lates japonicus]|uniref:Serine/threonine-protein kinase VRK2 isoform X1 n=1 Tax=Lates japonicus TaxID=270547 RepID=A0AAD3RIV6_LATJO|nr:serine/threonine-protein kinase VRK2 isoform X1 [Lates japonicus]